MAATNFQTSNMTFRQIMANGSVYAVPPYQRDYSWEMDQWSDLWEDVWEVYQSSQTEESAHYMGYLVLQEKENHSFQIIDGQQRLTTLSILVLAILKNLQRLIENRNEPERNEQRFEEIRRLYLGYTDIVTLNPNSKLVLNRNNKLYYEFYLLALGNLPLPNTASDILLKKSFEYFDRQVQKSEMICSSGEKLADFLNKITQKLFFTVIQVNDELNAFKVFETLNARGVQLSSTDLLKNYLFSIVGDQDRDDLERVWSAIAGKLEEEKFTDFLRIYWNSKHSLVRHSRLYTTVRSSIQSNNNPVGFLRDLDYSAETYRALTQPSDLFWEDKEQKQHIRDLLRTLQLFQIRQPLPLLLAAYQNLPLKTFVRVLEICVTLSFRYNIIGNFSPNQQEEIYNKTAIKISNKEISNISSFFNNVKDIYIEDDVFESVFADKIFSTKTKRNRDVVRYIFAVIEKSLSRIDINVSGDTYNIEHIFPENPTVSWEGIPKSRREHSLYRLGNLTILETSLNHQVGSRPFAEKKPLYAQSALTINTRIAEKFEEWTAEAIAARQQWLAKQAVRVWREELATTQ